MKRLKIYTNFFKWFLFAVCMIALVWPNVSFANTAKDKYYKAEACYKKLRNSSKKQKYRDQWLACIEKFQAVYRHDPSGSWAAAGLYKSGEIYQGLYKRSLRDSDRKEALDIFERIIKRYPKSRYKPRAENAIRNFSRKPAPKAPSKKVAPKKVDSNRSNSAKSKYVKAEACYKRLRNNPKKQIYRDQWLACIEKFQAVYRHDPSGPWAAAGLYKAGEVYQGLYKRSLRDSDRKKARDIFERIIKGYPESRYRSKAENAIHKYFPEEIPKIASKKDSLEEKKVEVPVDDIAR